MTPRPEGFLAAAVVFLVFAVTPLRVSAQSAGQLAAWDGLTLSPVGALAPVILALGGMSARSDDVAFRYGRWRYDADDAVHDSFGLTWTHALAIAHSSVALTAAYGLVECPTCSAWVLGGIDVQSTLWSHAYGLSPGRVVAPGVGVRLSWGGARHRGPDAATATSTAITVPLDLTVPFVGSSNLRASIIPGVGFGRIADADAADGGALPMIGGAIAWTYASFGCHVGAERVVIAGGPTQVGAALSWTFGTRARERP